MRLVYWETAHTVADQPPWVMEYAEIWQAADKIVFLKEPGKRQAAPKLEKYGQAGPTTAPPKVPG